MATDECFLENKDEDGVMPHHSHDAPRLQPFGSLTEALLDGLKSLYVRVSVGTAPRPDNIAKVHALIRTALLALEPTDGSEGDGALLDCRLPGAYCGGLTGWQLTAVSTLVRERLGEKLGVTDLAAAARLSESHFSRAFRATCGMSPMKYIAKARVEAAQIILLRDPLPLREVALICGFSDQSHFTKVFQAVAGESPRRWRRARELGPRTASSIDPQCKKMTREACSQRPADRAKSEHRESRS
jgi:AraC-like DNA-binding protein